MIKFHKSYLIIFLIIFVLSCNRNYTKQDKEYDIQLLLQSNENQRQAHLTGNARMLADEIADSMMSVSNGRISINTNDEIFNRFDYYFKNVEYLKWDDLQDPLINISNDGSFAEMTLQKIILLRNKNDQGIWEKGATLFSWTANHKKIEGKWKITANISTRENLEFSDYNKYYNKGVEALNHNKFDEYLFNLERAHFLAADNVSILYEYSKALTANGSCSKAMQILSRLADIRFIGLNSFESDPIFQKLKNEKDYDNLINRIIHNQNAINNSKLAFVINEKDLLPEGIAVNNNTGTIYLSSAYKRKIISIDKFGDVKNFKNEAEDGLWSTWGMEADESKNHLWVISSNTKQGMITKIPDDKNDGMCKVYKYDLLNGNLLRIYDYERGNEKHFFNDLTISKKGDVYITESLTSKIYKISAENDKIELLYQADPMFYFLNGLALNSDETKLFIANSEGIALLDLTKLNWQLLQIPNDISLEGIDGLAFYKGSLICQQSGHPNNSIMQYKLDASNYKVVESKILESNNSLFDSATTGELAGDYYYYIANSQINSALIWGNDGPEGIKHLDKLKDVSIFKIKL